MVQRCWNVFLAIVLALAMTAPLVEGYIVRNVNLDNNINRASNITSSLHKRWISVVDYETASAGGLLGPWPPCKAGVDRSYVLLCFENREAHEKLSPILFGAISMWAPALYPNSALSISPDPACGTDWNCICSTRTSPYTLTVRLGTEGHSSTSLGFDYSGVAHEEHNLHDMSFVPRTVQDWNDQTEVGLAYATNVRDFAHELGHSFGLGHEHQRGDASQHLNFNIKAFPSYETVREKVKNVQDEPLLQTRNSLDDRMTLISNYPRLTEKYWPEFLNYQSYDTDSATHKPKLIAGPAFDPDSIMIYSSDFGVKDGMLGHVLRIPRTDPSYDDRRMTNLVYTGGNADPRQARISKGDIERVKQLYPLRSGNNRQHVRAASSSHRLKVIIGTGFTTTVPPLPRSTLFDPDSKEAGFVGRWNRGWGEDIKGGPFAAPGA